MSVLENLIVAQHNKLMRASGYSVLGLIGWLGYAMPKTRRWSWRATGWTGRLTARANDNAGALPYGAQRRLEIARHVH